MPYRTFHYYECQRCHAMFVLEWPGKPAPGGHGTEQEMLLANPCRVCSKGALEFMGFQYLFCPEKTS